MRRISLMLTVAMMLGVAAGAIGVRTLSAQQQAEARRVLVPTDLGDIQGYEVRIWRTDIGPGVVGARHYHPGIRMQLRPGRLVDPGEGRRTTGYP
jgi:hypothetical protein